MIYDPSARLQDRLAPHEPPYRSRGEAQIGRLLERSGIDFQHERPTVVYDRGRYRIWKPDFTLPDYDSMIIEYAGMMDRPDYAAGIRHKKRAYARNEIPELFVYPLNLRLPDWPSHVLRSIELCRNSAARHAVGIRSSHERL